MSDRPLVFDAEPLIAHAADETGGDQVEELLDTVRSGDRDGYVSQVTLAEVRYIIARKHDRDVADRYLDWLVSAGIETINTDGVWRETADYVLEYNPALGDAVALATAERIGGALVIGGDDDYDEVTDVPLERFREGAD